MTATAPPQTAVDLGHTLVWDPPGLSSGARWTCSTCGKAALRYETNEYGSATEDPCTTTEGHHRCGSCLQWVGTAYDGETRPYRTFVGSDDRRRYYFCADKDVCNRRQERAKDDEHFAATEARIHFPEPEDEDEDEDPCAS